MIDLEGALLSADQPRARRRRISQARVRLSLGPERLRGAKAPPPSPPRPRLASRLLADVTRKKKKTIGEKRVTSARPSRSRGPPDSNAPLSAFRPRRGGSGERRCHLGAGEGTGRSGPRERRRRGRGGRLVPMLYIPVECGIDPGRRRLLLSHLEM